MREKCLKILESLINPGIGGLTFYVVNVVSLCIGRGSGSSLESSLILLSLLVAGFTIALFAVEYSRDRQFVRDMTRMKDIVYKQVLPYSILALLLSIDDAYVEVGSVLGIYRGPSQVGIVVHSLVFVALMGLLGPSRK